MQEPSQQERRSYPNLQSTGQWGRIFVIVLLLIGVIWESGNTFPDEFDIFLRLTVFAITILTVIEITLKSFSKWNGLFIVLNGIIAIAFNPFKIVKLSSYGEYYAAPFATIPVILVLSSSIYYLKERKGSINKETKSLNKHRNSNIIQSESELIRVDKVRLQQSSETIVPSTEKIKLSPLEIIRIFWKTPYGIFLLLAFPIAILYDLGILQSMIFKDQYNDPIKGNLTISLISSILIFILPSILLRSFIGQFHRAATVVFLILLYGATTALFNSGQQNIHLGLAGLYILYLSWIILTKENEYFKFQRKSTI